MTEHTEERLSTTEPQHSSVLNRSAQRRILYTLANANPRGIDSQTFKDLEISIGEDALIAELLYLEEHGLIESGIQRGMHDFMVSLSAMRITAQGLDFLEEDGGLSAILSVVTVKLHDDTIKKLIAARIEKSDLPPEEKRKFLDQLRELPGKATEHLVLKLLDLGLESAPGAIATIGTHLTQAIART